MCIRDSLITWREEGIKIRDWTDLRTGTPFDYILDAKARRKRESEAGFYAQQP
jgi:hypothetical protein